MNDAAHKPSTSLVALAFDWWQRARERWLRLNDLDQLSIEEIERLAHDVGMNGTEFLRVAIQPNGLAELLERRLTALALDPEDIRLLSPLLLRDLQRTCIMCEVKERCAADMVDDANPPGWESYCPNSGTLRTLR